MQLPNTFIIGAPKTGTTALTVYLRDHPDVYFSTPKEPFYWCQDYPEMSAALDIVTLEDYLQLFDGPAAAKAKVRAEGTTHYLHSREAIPRIEANCPGSKYIAMLRNPVEVVHAYHGELIFHLQEDQPDFETAWRLREERVRGNHLPQGMRALHNTQYHEFGLYGEQLERFFNLVPEDRRLVIIFDDFKRDVGAVYRQILQFLGLPDDHRTEFPKIYEARKNRFSWVAKLQHHPPRLLKPFVLGTRFMFDRYAGQSFMRSVRKLLHAPNPRKSLSAEFQSELKEFFRDDVEKASRLLNRDLSFWTSDSSAAVTA